MRIIEEDSPYKGKDIAFWQKHPELAIGDTALESLIREATSCFMASGKNVGAAVMVPSGEIFSGCPVRADETIALSAEAAAMREAMDVAGKTEAGNDPLGKIVVVSEDPTRYRFALPAIRKYFRDALLIGVDPQGSILTITSVSELAAGQQ